MKRPTKKPKPLPSVPRIKRTRKKGPMQVTHEDLKRFKEVKEVFEHKLSPNDQAAVLRSCLGRHVDPVPPADIKWASRALFVALYDPKISEGIAELVLRMGRENALAQEATP
jgi:hypothetical protein